MSLCLGYPKCDGNLPGEPHEPECPMYGKEQPSPASAPNNEYPAAIKLLCGEFVKACEDLEQAEQQAQTKWERAVEESVRLLKERNVAEEKLEQAEAERSALNKQISACVFAGCDVGYNQGTGEAKASNRMTIERDAMKAERDSLKARLQQLEGALRRQSVHKRIGNTTESRLETDAEYAKRLKDLLTPPAAGEEG